MALYNKYGTAIIKADELTRTHRERLMENGFICEVIKGWYISCIPEEKGHCWRRYHRLCHIHC